MAKISSPWGDAPSNRGHPDDDNYQELIGIQGASTPIMRNSMVHTSRSSQSDLALERARRLIDFEGPTVLSDDELLAVLLGRGGEGLSPLAYAQGVIERTGGLAALSRNHAGDLKEQPGLGLAQAARLLAAFELGKRCLRDASRVASTDALSKETVSRWAHPRLTCLEHEEVWVLCVDAQSKLKSTWQAGRGGIHGCGLLARDILVPVVRDAASGFVLVHNHPSGDSTPSREDIALTRGLSAAASAVCIPLLDHVIVSRGGSQSFFELGLL